MPVMPLCKTEAILLRSHRLGETSKIVTLFTDGYGKIAAVAKGARRPKSRFGASLDLFAHSKIVFYKKENRDLYLISESTLVHALYGLREDARRLGFASAAVELVDRMVMREERTPGLFPLLLGGLMALEGGVHLSRLLSALMLKIVAILGFRPQLFVCNGCRRTIEGQVAGFSAVRGGVLCRDCGRGDVPFTAITPQTLETLQHFLADDFEMIDRLKTGHGEERRVAAIVSGFVRRCAEDHRPLASLKFLEGLKK
jgi:DNA repair protein RecO (recombination protein O)